MKNFESMLFALEVEMSEIIAGPYKVEEGEKYPLYDHEVDIELIVSGPAIRQFGFSSAGCDSEGSGPASALELKNNLNTAYTQGRQSMRAEVEELKRKDRVTLEEYGRRCDEITKLQVELDKANSQWEKLKEMIQCDKSHE